MEVILLIYHKGPYIKYDRNLGGGIAFHRDCDLGFPNKLNLDDDPLSKLMMSRLLVLQVMHSIGIQAFKSTAFKSLL